MPLNITTLNPSDRKNTQVDLSNGNLTAQGMDISANQWVRSTLPRSRTSRVYFEFTAGLVANSVVGISQPGAIVYPGSDNNSFGLFSNGTVAMGGAFTNVGAPYTTNGTIVGIAVDFNVQRAWFRSGSGFWNGSASNNPTTNVGGWSFAGYPINMNNLAIVSGDAGYQTTINFGATTFSRPAPDNFQPWNGGDLDFQSSPTDGQVFSNGTLGPIWVYNSTKGAWTRNKGTADPDNKIVNPTMQISQENGNTLLSATNAYAADCFINQLNGGTGTFQRIQSTSPRGSPNRIRAIATSTFTNGQFIGFFTRIEGHRMYDMKYGKANSQYSILRIGINASAGVYSLCMSDPGNVRSYTVPLSITVPNVDTEFVFVVPPEPTGAFWAATNGIGIKILIYVGKDTANIHPAPGTWAVVTSGAPGYFHPSATMPVSGDKIEVFDVGWYIDPNMTGKAPEFQQNNYEDDLTECMRYWYKAYSLRGIIASTTQGQYIGAPHPVPIRATPTYALGGTPTLGDLATAPAISSVTNVSSDIIHVGINANIASGSLTVGRPASIMCSGSEVNYIAVNSRL